MGIAPRQIGWSNESNLLWNISKQLDRLTAVMASISPGGGGTNPTSTFVPFNNAGTFADSFLVNDTTASVLKTVYSASDIGLKLDFANGAYFFGYNNLGLFVDSTNEVYDLGSNSVTGSGVGISVSGVPSGGYIAIGDYFNSYNGTSFYVEDPNQIIKTKYGGNDIGLKLDFANDIYQFGKLFGDNFCISIDYNTQIFNIGDAGFWGNGTVFQLDNSNAQIKSIYQNNDIGLMLDFANNEFYFGSPYSGNTTYLYIADNSPQIQLVAGANTNATSFQIYDSTQIIKTTNQGNDIGLKLDFANGTYNLGDFGAAVNGSFLGIDDSNECWVTSNNVTETTAGASANKYILVKIGSTVYKLQLFNYA